MSASLPSKQNATKDIEITNLKTNAPYKLSQLTKNNECNFLINMINEECSQGIDFSIKIKKVPIQTEETCADISKMLERCILDGHDCNTSFHKFNVLCKEYVDIKL